MLFRTDPRVLSMLLLMFVLLQYSAARPIHAFSLVFLFGDVSVLFWWCYLCLVSLYLCLSCAFS